MASLNGRGAVGPPIILDSTDVTGVDPSQVQGAVGTAATTQKRRRFKGVSRKRTIAVATDVVKKHVPQSLTYALPQFARDYSRAGCLGLTLILTILGVWIGLIMYYGRTSYTVLLSNQLIDPKRCTATPVTQSAVLTLDKSGFFESESAFTPADAIWQLELNRYKATQQDTLEEFHADLGELIDEMSAFLAANVTNKRFIEAYQIINYQTVKKTSDNQGFMRLLPNFDLLFMLQEALASYSYARKWPEGFQWLPHERAGPLPLTMESTVQADKNFQPLLQLPNGNFTCTPVDQLFDAPMKVRGGLGVITVGVQGPGVTPQVYKRRVTGNQTIGCFGGDKFNTAHNTNANNQCCNPVSFGNFTVEQPCAYDNCGVFSNFSTFVEGTRAYIQFDINQILGIDFCNRYRQMCLDFVSWRNNCSSTAGHDCTSNSNLVGTSLGSSEYYPTLLLDFPSGNSSISKYGYNYTTRQHNMTGGANKTGQYTDFDHLGLTPVFYRWFFVIPELHSGGARCNNCSALIHPDCDQLNALSIALHFYWPNKTYFHTFEQDLQINQMVNNQLTKADIHCNYTDMLFKDKNSLSLLKQEPPFSLESGVYNCTIPKRRVPLERMSVAWGNTWLLYIPLSITFGLVAMIYAAVVQNKESYRAAKAAAQAKTLNGDDAVLTTPDVELAMNPADSAQGFLTVQPSTRT